MSTPKQSRYWAGAALVGTIAATLVMTTTGIATAATGPMSNALRASTAAPTMTRPPLPTSTTLIVQPTQATASTTYRTISSWSDGYVGEFTLSDTTAERPAWPVRFSLPAGTTLTSAWGVEVTTNGTQVTATPSTWQPPVSPGHPVMFGIMVHGSAQPVDCFGKGHFCLGTISKDTVAPEPPSGLSHHVHSDMQSVTFQWSPATDNIGVVGYEVHLFDELITTVTDTSAVVPITPSRLFFTLSVTAIDAAGNRSAPAELPFDLCGTNDPRYQPTSASPSR